MRLAEQGRRPVPAPSSLSRRTCSTARRAAHLDPDCGATHSSLTDTLDADAQAKPETPQTRSQPLSYPRVGSRTRCAAPRFGSSANDGAGGRAREWTSARRREGARRAPSAASREVLRLSSRYLEQGILSL
ncbi:uncharacterized protein RHOBADRAFT_66894, partial [Rhodotorula graminis WP1]